MMGVLVGLRYGATVVPGLIRSMADWPTGQEHLLCRGGAKHSRYLARAQTDRAPKTFCLHGFRVPECRNTAHS